MHWLVPWLSSTHAYARLLLSLVAVTPPVTRTLGIPPVLHDKNSVPVERHKQCDLAAKANLEGNKKTALPCMVGPWYTMRAFYEIVYSLTQSLTMHGF